MNRYNKTIIAVFIAAIADSGIPFAAATEGENALHQEILNLKHQVERLEKSHQAINTSHAADSSWFNRIGLSGLVEVEAGYNSGPDSNESDITLATVELGVDAQVTPWVNTHVLILFEEDGTDPPEIDEGIITLGKPDASPFSLAVGQIYVPFGNYESSLVSDPLTLEIGETRESAVQVGYVSGGLYGSTYLFNGDTNDGSEQIDQFGFNLGLTKDAKEGGIGYSIGLSWINSLADSNALQEAVTDSDNLADKVPGFSMHAIIHTGPLTLIGEHLTATESFDATDLAFNGSGAKPAAFNLEAGYAFALGGKEANFALAWQETKEAMALELPETRYLAALSVDTFENTTLAFEYAHNKDYAASEGGSEEDADIFTAQLSVTF
jgi:hypothetical protein